MSDKTGIAWTEATWNPLAGCSVVSPGCTNCYAMKMAARIERMGGVPHYAGLTTPSKKGAVWNGTVRMAPDAILLKPLHWKRPRRIFVNSMSDLFHEAVSDEDIDRVFAVMALTPQHTYQVLTKRAERMRDYINAPATRGRVIAAMKNLSPKTSFFAIQWPLPNVWMGVSTEDQARADERIPFLLDTPAAVRWISAEPLLGSVNASLYLKRVASGRYLPALRGMPLASLDWVVAGGESGPGARPMHPDWARSLRDQCAGAGVPFFFKQWGAWTPGENVARSSGTVDTADWFDGRWTFDRENLANSEGHVDDQPDVYCVGKRAAGHLLDGVEHFAWPEVRS